MRIIKEIEIQQNKALALFDTGSLHTYVSSRLLDGVPVLTLSKPYKVALGGQIIEVKTQCLVEGTIEGLVFSTSVVPIEKVGKVDGREVDVVIGAPTMEEWEIIPNRSDGTLDLSGLKRREFTEFVSQINDRAEITGHLNEEAVDNYVAVLNGGSFPVLLRKVGEREQK